MAGYSRAISSNKLALGLDRRSATLPMAFLQRSRRLLICSCAEIFSTPREEPSRGNGITTRSAAASQPWAQAVTKCSRAWAVSLRLGR